jgi:two-component system sensor histidine kinase/response regulator
MAQQNIQTPPPGGQFIIEDYLLNTKERSDKLINYFLISYFIIGLSLAGFYNTYAIAIGTGGISLLAYYSTKWMLPASDLYQYVLSVCLGIFMAQFIYQMHGMFEMHFFAFIGSAILITYQNWKLQIPMLIIVTIHHLGLNYLQSIGYGEVFFTSLDYLELQSMTIHILLTIVIFFICGLRSYHLKKYSGAQQNMLAQIYEREIYQHSLEELNRELQLSHRSAVDARHDAEKSAQAKSTFLATMSHEIRTPMYGVIGMTSLLSETSLTTEQADYVNVIRTSGESLLNVINDVLDFSKIESGHMQLEEKSFGLRKCVGDVIDLFANKAKSQDIALLYKIDQALPDRLTGDASRLRQVLINLVNNAIKFTPKGNVKLSVRQLSATPGEVSLQFEISDTGIGIPTEKQSQLFKAFSQVDSSDTRRYEGTGLGLVISERLVNLMKGTIKVKSTVNEGSVFYFQIALPICTAPLAPQLPEHEDEQKPQVILRENFAQEHPLQILIAEDNPINLKLATIILSKLGYQPDTAFDGKDAVEKSLLKKYDLILMDIMMPVMNGLEATKIIRSTFNVQPTIVAMTANAMPEDRLKCMEAGMDNYLSKPIELILLVEVLRNVKPAQ